MITENHIANQRRNKTISSLNARITVMTEMVSDGEIPSWFNYHKSNARLLKWEDKRYGIYPVGVNTARDKHPELWEQLQGLRVSLKRLEKESDIAKKKIKSKRKDEINAKKRQAENQVKALTNELIMIRRAYLDLLSYLEQEKRKSKVIQDAIQRHYQHFGLQKALSDRK